MPFGACTQAHVYPAAWAKRLSDHLCRRVGDGPKDVLTHRLARSDGLRTHLVQPLLFQHVGVYSVIRNMRKDPADVVSAEFSAE